MGKPVALIFLRKDERMKNIIFGAFGVMGSVAIKLFGGWDMTLQILITLMVVDYLSGLVVAGVF